jgi:hypothetical protein
VIDLARLAERVQEQVEGVNIEHDRDGRFVNLSIVNDPAHRLLMDVYPSGEVFSGGCVWSPDTRRMMRVVLDALDEQDTP